jgi:hypothetical protein
MSTFDPEVACRVHDKLNDQVLIWKPEWADDYRQHADDFGDGVIEWDGLLLDAAPRCIMNFAPDARRARACGGRMVPSSQCASPHGG